MKKIFIAAGGTGGHIYPGLAIAEAIKTTIKDAEITFIGSYVGMEKDVIPKYGYPMHFIRARGFEKGFSKETLEAIKGIFECQYDAKKLLKKEKPHLVIGTGGFTCAMLLREASRLSIPTMIHEQNAYPGRANRMLGKYVDRVAISFEEARQYFPKEKTILTGNPVREVFKYIDREEARKKAGIKSHQKMILASGGSQGAGSINEAMLEYIVKHSHNKSRFFVHLTGQEQYEQIMMKASDFGIDNHIDNVKIIPFSSEMNVLLGASDLAISRAGAMSVAELAATGTPSILVPYPKAAGDHQTVNAKAIEDLGGAIIIKDQALNGELLATIAEELLENETQLKMMSDAARQYGNINADVQLAELSKELMS